MTDELVTAPIHRNKKTAPSIAARAEIKRPAAVQPYNLENVEKKTYNLTKEGKDTPSLSTLGEEKDLSDENRTTESALFDFSKVAKKQPQRNLNITATEGFQESFFKLAEELGLEDHRELFRRAIFAAAKNPSTLLTPSIDACETAYKATTNSKGGLRNSGPRENGKFVKY